MADWTAIPDSSIEPGKPIRSIDGLALRDNPIAAFEGAAGAPRLADAALGPAASATVAGRDWVLARTALADVGAVGTYALMMRAEFSAAPGATAAGSSLRYSGTEFTYSGYVTLVSSAATPAGTWRCMGNSSVGIPGDRCLTLWLRIA